MRYTLLPVLLASGLTAPAQEPPRLDKATQQQLRQATLELSDAQKAGDEAAVKRAARRAIDLLGDRAGVPEVADEFRSVPKDAKALARDEIAAAFSPYGDFIAKQKWWAVGLEPTKTNHALREVAAVIEGCLAARRAGADNPDKLLAVARDAGDFLVWAQDRAGTGVVPFPAVRNGKGRPFEVAERFYQGAEKDGTLDRVIKNGWAVEDFDDGGLQFDNGLAGAALLRLYDATKDEKYKKAAVRAADWALARRVVTNWNYNSFSVYLLAEAHRVTGERKYLDAAATKARLGVLPGQLTAGARAGRWADPHNARPAYHYIMVRGLAALAAVLPKDHADLPAVVGGLRLALKARNPDFANGVVSADSAVEALVRVQALPPHVASKLGDCGTDAALDALERYAAAGFRARQAALGPGAWGLLLEHVHGRKP